ncbi:MAG: spermidine synthase [Magnetococcales bacterium]|nr:spermidine synthase [Magnetococcales bacterium]
MNLFPGSITRNALSVVHRSWWSGQVIEVVDDGPLRLLHFGTYLKQSCILRANPRRLVLPYTRSMLTVLLFQRQPGRVLMIGLGGGTMARFLLDHFPECQIDAVEIVPEMPELARRYFGLPQSSRLRVSIGDGADFLHFAARQAVVPRYDLLLVDAFDAAGMAATIYAEAFFRDCRALLTDNGVMAVNLSRGREEVFRQSLAAIDLLFDQATRQFRPEGSNNVILLAACRPESLRLRPGFADGCERVTRLVPPFSDLFSPGDLLTLPWWRYVREF